MSFLHIFARKRGGQWRLACAVVLDWKHDEPKERTDSEAQFKAQTCSFKVVFAEIIFGTVSFELDLQIYRLKSSQVSVNVIPCDDVVNKALTRISRIMSAIVGIVEIIPQRISDPD